MIDFHCHLDLYPDPPSVKAECIRRGIYMLSVTTTPSAWQGTSELASSSRNVTTALGLHPQLAAERQHELGLFDALLSEAQFIGEIGLDGGPEFRHTRANQMAVFEHVLAKCTEVGGRVMSIHSRHAAGEVLDCLRRYPSAGTAVLHWFSGTARELSRAIELGCWFTVGPAMLSGRKGRDLAAQMPRERILTESDGPFANVEGKVAMPWDVQKAVSCLAKTWGTSEAFVSGVLEENLGKLCSGKPDWAPMRESPT